MQSKQIRFMSMVVTLIALCLLLSVPALAKGQGGVKGKGPKPVGAVNSSNGGVYARGQYGIVGKYIYLHADDYYHGDDKVDYKRPKPGKKGKKVKEKTLNKYQLTLRTGVFDNFDARLVIPLLDKELKRESARKSFTDDNVGIGDIKLIGRYRVMSQKKKDPLNLAIGLGLEMPTGDTDKQDSNGKHPGWIQTGWGSWNPIFEVGVHKVMGRHWISTHVMYKMSTEGDRGSKDFEGPDVFKYNAAYVFATCNWFDVGLELNGEFKTKAKLSGVTLQKTGGHTVFITPEVHFKLYKGLHFDIGVPITVYRDLNGEQLSEDYRVVTKLAYKF
ncbi:MAG: hypothetical protein CSA21_05810 [Deltaproteobacteria bacterium]|nr:MAG: hypothetical protein CSA21_05810 [Deltaproteobacteria bacterium]